MEVIISAAAIIIVFSMVWYEYIKERREHKNKRK